MTTPAPVETLPTVLVVDDEAHVRTLVRRILERDGYHVSEAGTGHEAIEMLGTGRVTPDLLMSDVHMPDLGGVEMVEQIRLTKPSLKVLYVSGYVDRLMRDRPALPDGEAYLDKPFSAAGLLEAVSLILYGTLKKPAR
jgi:CheY-like chemotaxis protein